MGKFITQVALLVGLIAVSVAKSPNVRLAPRAIYALDQLSLSVDGTSVELTVVSSTDETVSILNGNLGVALSPDLATPSECGDSPICLEWSDGTKLAISKDDRDYAVEWTTGTVRLEDRFDVSTAPLYGGGESFIQRWPIQDSPRPEKPYVTGDFFQDYDGYSGVVESYWLSATGAALYVPEDIPLFVSLNVDGNNLLTLIAQHASPYLTNNEQNLRLKYHIITGTDARDTQLYAVNKFLGKPSAVLDERVVRDPIWSTWARFGTAVDEEKTISYANEIVSHNFISSHFEIDDKWEPCYGAFQFDSTKFPDPVGMISQLHEKGFRVTAWVYPFVNTDCIRFQEGDSNGYFVKTSEGVTGITSWWEGAQSGAVDFTNPNAVEWYVSILEQLKSSTGLDGYKFDAGETRWLPSSYILNTSLELQPNSYTTSYVTAISRFGTFSEVRSGRRTQNLPIMTRLMDRNSVWGYDNGLKSTIPALLNFNIVGYPFVLPDMIGGNWDLPPRELFIRWLQANTFMPVLQYSHVPWDYDVEVVEIAHRYTDIHKQYADKIMELAAKSVTDGTPINPPIWWLDPNDKEAQTIDSEYLLGEDLLVAPVLEEGATSRDIYLPAGRWRDELDPNHPEIEGKAWLRGYPVPLSDLAYFTRIA